MVDGIGVRGYINLGAAQTLLKSCSTYAFDTAYITVRILILHLPESAQVENRASGGCYPIDPHRVRLWSMDRTFLLSFVDC